MEEPSTGLRLKLHWVPSHLTIDTTEQVAIELQDSNGGSVASISVPSICLFQEVVQKLELQASISPEGLVSATSGEFAVAFREEQATDLDQLIAEAIAPEMLEDEPEAAQMLSKFRDRLLRSLEHVEKAIASLPKA